MYIIMGLPGAGKTTVINEFLKNNPEWKVVTYGTLMFEVAKQFGVENRDEIRKLDTTLQKKIQREVAIQLSKIKEEKVILDTHASIKTPHGYLPGLPLHILQNLKVDGIVLITAKPEEIIKRRTKDKTRERDKENIEELREHDEINKRMCSTYSVITGSEFSIIYNKEGELEKSVEILEKVLKTRR